MRRLAALAALWVGLAQAQVPAAPFDHTHAAWTALLQASVAVADRGHASRVSYAGLAAQRPALQSYLASLSRVGAAEFGGWTKAQRMAFLINAYNAFMSDKVLTRYPDLRSVWDFGRVFGNPFKDRFFTLFGQPTSLDEIEHGMLRKPGAYDDVRVHFAVNCASIGCPMLRPEAYVADRLDAQLEDQARRFLSDRGRNRYDAASGRLAVSKIFDWFKEDWRRGTRNFDGRGAPVASRRAWLARYAALLADDPADRARVASGQAPLEFLDYDWTLNDAAPRH
jgi:Protein of unknown function, DUF547